MTDQPVPTDVTDEPLTADEPTTSPAAAPANASASDASGRTRRQFVRGVAAAGASTAAAVALDGAGITNLIGDSAVAAGKPIAFSEFTAIAPSIADQVQVPEGFRADMLISWGDAFENTDGTAYTYGFNNDFLAYMPLKGKKNEALLFANHEYPSPFFQHGNTNAAAKTPEQIAIEKEAVGASIVHIKRGKDGVWGVVTPSPYNRRITGDEPTCEMTGPIAGSSQPNAAVIGGSAMIEKTSQGSLANCSGGITPWGTVLTCEENFQDYDQTTGFGYGWTGPGNEKYNRNTYAHYGWVVEVDPYDPSSTPRKHTALGRFRHENTAFRAEPGKKFVLYMGDDKADEGVYKFVSDREFLPGRRAHNLKILEEGTLYIAKWSPEGRRRFANNGDTVPISATSGTGEWVEVQTSELVDCANLLRQRIGAADYTQYFATNRPEDVEVDVDGTVYVAFTNNSSVRDRHGCVRKLVEAGNDPAALTFEWSDYSNGGPTGRDGVGEEGISCADNLVFDQANNLWIVTDISSSAIKGSTSPAAWYDYHASNAVFMVPRSGPNAGVAFRFANMPVDAEGTGPYFSDDYSTLFLAVQHPGEETPDRGGVFGDEQTYTSWWPDGNKTAGVNPAMPRPTTIAITRVEPGVGSTTIPATDPPAPTLAPIAPLSGAALRARGVVAEVTCGEPSTVSIVLRVSIKAGWWSTRSLTLASERKKISAGTSSIALRPSPWTRALLSGARITGGDVRAVVTAADGQPAPLTLTQPITVR